MAIWRSSSLFMRPSLTIVRASLERLSSPLESAGAARLAMPAPPVNEPLHAVLDFADAAFGGALAQYGGAAKAHAQAHVAP